MVELEEAVRAIQGLEGVWSKGWDVMSPRLHLRNDLDQSPCQSGKGWTAKCGNSKESVR
jgi:hypothetical protein